MTKEASIQPRCFALPHPLFNEKSPWNQKIVGDDATAPDSEAQTLVTFEILRDYSWEVLGLSATRNGDTFATKLGELLSDPPMADPDQARYLKLARQVRSACRALSRGEGLFQGGSAQSPQVASDDYAFPIYRTARANGERIKLLMRPYNKIDWDPKPPYKPREKADCKWYADEVPTPECTFRPGGPRNRDADGNIVLWHPEAKEVFDFWQVTTKRDDDEKSMGGGFPGDEMLEVGTVTRWAMDGLGARAPDDEIRYSARASGLPYLGGLLVPEDFKNGVEAVIPHALAFVLPRLRSYGRENDPRVFVYPATRTETTFGIPNPHALRAGQRIRLKETIRTYDGRVLKREEWPDLPPVVRIFFTALRDYGAFLVDGGGGLTFAAEDKHTANMKTKEAEDLGATVGCKETPWEALIGTINDYLSWQLFLGDDDHENVGLPFGHVGRVPSGSYEFWSNFEVVKDLEEPDDCK